MQQKTFKLDLVAKLASESQLTRSTKSQSDAALRALEGNGRLERAREHVGIS